MAVVVQKYPRIGFFSYLVTPPTLVAIVARKMKYFEHFVFSNMKHFINGYPLNQIHPFYYFLPQQLSFKNSQKVQFQARSDIHVAMETKMRNKAKLACVQLFKLVSMLHMLYKLMSTYLCLLVILYHKLRQFSNFAIMLLLWLPWIPTVETF